MKSLLQVFMEQIQSIPLIFRLTLFEIKQEFSGHYFGILWHIINPLTQILVYWFVFGIGLRSGAPVNGVPYITWLLCGIVPWFFISPNILTGANSVYKRISFASKMNFPISILPSISLLTSLVPFLIMSILLVFHLIASGFFPDIKWLQTIYYFISMIAFMYAFGLFNSTITVIFIDYQQILQALSRVLIFVTPVFWSSSGFNEQLLKLMALNPFFYIVEGFRYSLLPGQPHINSVPLTIYFWSITIFFLISGSMLHMKYRKNFVDYL